MYACVCMHVYVYVKMVNKIPTVMTLHSDVGTMNVISNKILYAVLSGKNANKPRESEIHMYTLVCTCMYMSNSNAHPQRSTVNSRTTTNH